MTRYTLHVPNQDNDGEPLAPWIRDRIEWDLLRIAGGYTKLDGVGAYRGDDRIYREPVTLYVADAVNADADFARVAELVAVELRQESVYVTKQSIEVEFITPSRKVA